jgi:hypothetical protein
MQLRKYLFCGLISIYKNMDMKMTEKELAKRVVEELGYECLMRITGLKYSSINSWTKRRIPPSWYCSLKLSKPRLFAKIENETRP